MNEMTPNSRPGTDTTENDISRDEMFRQVIQRAILNGWLTILNASLVKWEVQEDAAGKLVVLPRIAGQSLSPLYNEYILFDKDFAKALWGDEEAEYYVEYTWGENEPIEWLEDIDGISVKVKRYQHHLQQMVIADDPIKYAWEHLQ